MSKRIAVQLNVSTSPEKVFQALTLSEELRRWFAEHAHVSLTEKRYDFWDLSLENLRGWLERKAVGARCDFSSVQRGDVRLSAEIGASREAVFQALIKPEDLERYIAKKAVVEPRVGGRYSFGWKNDGPVKILDLVANEKLSYSWWYKRPEDTIVTWTLEGSGGRTWLILEHSGFGVDRSSEDYRTGWLAFLVRIKALVESGSAWHAPIFSATDHATTS